MRILTTTLTIALAIGMIGLSGTANAGCGGKRHGGHYACHPHRKVIVHKPWEVIVEKPVYVPAPVAAHHSPCFRPYHPVCTVVPGDTWYTISQRMYGTPVFWPILARANGLSATAQLIVGQPITLPVINQDGTIQQQPPFPFNPASTQAGQIGQLPASVQAAQPPTPPSIPPTSQASAGSDQLSGINFNNLAQLAGSLVPAGVPAGQQAPANAQ